MKGKYKYIKQDDSFIFYKRRKKLQTPSGADVITEYESIAERLVKDLNEFGEDPSNPISLVAFHYAMIDFYSNMELGRDFIEHSIAIGLDRERDWTFNCPTADPDVLMTWYGTFGLFEKQSPKGKEWLSTLSSMQLCAICVIGRALESVNIPYIIANIKDMKQLDHYSQFIDKFYPYVGIENLNKYFKNLLFYFNVEGGNDNKCESQLKNDLSDGEKFEGAFEILEKMELNKGNIIKKGSRIDFVELLIQEAQHQGWLAKDRELKFIVELVSMQSNATEYLLKFMFEQIVEDEAMGTTYTFMMTRYLFAKSVEAAIAWGHSKDGKISIYYHTKHLIDKQLEFEIPKTYQKYAMDSLKVGESLFSIYNAYMLNETKIGEKVDLYSSTKELFNWIQKLGIHYALENNFDVLWNDEKKAMNRNIKVGLESDLIDIGNGNKYEGQFQNGLMEGMGTLYFASGSKYVGQFKNGRKEGDGAYYYNNGDKYVGQYKNNLINGFGAYYYKSGNKYVGQFKNDLKEGNGTLYLANDDKYVGRFKNGRKEGEGTYYHNNGDKYVGQYKNDQKEGNGIYYYNDGNKYEGQWKNSLMEGDGTFYYNGGDKYVGQFKNDLMDGIGTYYFANGTIYFEGKWSKGEHQEQ